MENKLEQVKQMREQVLEQVAQAFANSLELNRQADLQHNKAVGLLEDAKQLTSQLQQLSQEAQAAQPKPSLD